MTVKKLCSGVLLYSERSGQFASNLIDRKWNVKLPIEIKIPEGVKFGDVLRLKGRGVPAHARGKAGDIYVNVRIQTPARLSAKAKKMIDELRKEGI